MRENIRINKVGDRIVPMLGDAREIVERYLARKADRVLMPLPELARRFFDVALLALRPRGGVVHFYDFGRAPGPFESSLEFTRKAAAAENLKVEPLASRVVRSYAPKCYHVVLDLAICT
jgi:tRNA (guanine37-N1)-methyltransferase